MKSCVLFLTLCCIGVRMQQLEVENMEMLVSMSRLKTQTEKLDEVCVRVYRCVCVCLYEYFKCGCVVMLTRRFGVNRS